MMGKQAATGREHVTATVAQHTRARIEVISRQTGMSKGQILDLAIDALDMCETCDASGRCDDENGADRRCPNCGGFRLHPRRG